MTVDDFKWGKGLKQVA